MKQKSSRQ